MKGREGGRGREAFTVAAVTVAGAACSALQQPAPRSRHATQSWSRTMSFGPCLPGQRALSNSAALRSEDSGNRARDHVYTRERELMGARTHTGSWA